MPTASPIRLDALRILVLDADPAVVRPLESRARAAGWGCSVLGEGPLSPGDVVASRAHALVADVRLLGGAAQVASLAAELPALALLVTAPAATPVAARAAVLRAGADDWIAQPAHPEEVLARVEAVVRRLRAGRGAGLDSGGVAAGELEIHPELFQAHVRGASIELTRREFELLALLAGAEGRVLEREEIYERVWGYAMAHGDRSVDVFVRKLRRKLRAASPGWRYLHTHVGVGYRFAAVPQESGAGAS